MSGIEEHLAQLSPLWEEREISEEPRIIDIDSQVSDFSEDTLNRLLQLAHNESDYFNDFEVTYHTDRTGEQPIVRSGRNLRVHNSGFDTLQEAFSSEDIQTWRQVANDSLHDDDAGRLAEFLLEWSGTATISLHVDCIVDKSEISEQLKSGTSSRHCLVERVRENS